MTIKCPICDEEVKDVIGQQVLECGACICKFDRCGKTLPCSGGFTCPANTTLDTLITVIDQFQRVLQHSQMEYDVRMCANLIIKSAEVVVSLASREDSQ